MSQIGWGAGWSPDGPPATSPFSLRSGTTSPYAGLETFTPRLFPIGAFTTVEFSYVWSPVTPGQAAEVFFLDFGTSFGAEVGFIDRPGYTAGWNGTFTISALIDGAPADNVLILVITPDYDWYNTFAWDFALTGPSIFWTGFVGTRET